MSESIGYRRYMMKEDLTTKSLTQRRYNEKELKPEKELMGVNTREKRRSDVQLGEDHSLAY